MIENCTYQFGKHKVTDIDYSALVCRVDKHLRKIVIMNNCYFVAVGGNYCKIGDVKVFQQNIEGFGDV